MSIVAFSPLSPLFRSRGSIKGGQSRRDDLSPPPSSNNKQPDKHKPSKMCIIYQVEGVCGHTIPTARRRCADCISGDICKRVELILEGSESVCPLCWLLGLLLWFIRYVVVREILFGAATLLACPEVASMFALGSVVSEAKAFLVLLICYIKFA
ncbi:hypothetical protein GJ744_000158 [Endocarpon pusillum]|uniref:Uncharacterized protein n=1 Tax=Endocarpon pusillum TaxID=364733 RepID=A0A8H7AS69_9EURO|nr:hypothetical protein GJ744_000158 [Endocarpon pusillum]